VRWFTGQQIVEVAVDISNEYGKLTAKVVVVDIGPRCFAFSE
jgi:hypothetical protein